MGYFEVDGMMRDAESSMGATPEPYLLFNITCEGVGTFQYKRCLKCMEGWELADTGFSSVVGKRKTVFKNEPCKMCK